MSTTASSPDPLQLSVNSDKENSHSHSNNTSTTTAHLASFAAPSSAATTGSNKQQQPFNQTTSTTATLSATTHRTTKTTSTRGKTATARRGRGAKPAAAAAVAGHSAHATTTMQSAPSPRRRSTRTRSRSRSTSMSMSISTGRSMQAYEDNNQSDDNDNDDARSVASSSATATRTGNHHHHARSSNIGSNRREAGEEQLEGDQAAPVTTPSPPRSSAAGPARSARKPTSKGKQAARHGDDLLDRVEHVDSEDAASAQPHTQQQRGRGTSFIQQSERPSQASLKDTSVNIATAFRQAAVGGDQSGANVARPSQSISTSVVASTSTTVRLGPPASSAGIGFLSRAGDRQVPLVLDPSGERDSQQPEQAHYDLSNSPPSDQRQAIPPTSASKKRKSRGSASVSKARTTTSKDTTWKPSKEELANMSTDEYTSEGAITTDPEDLTKYVENPWGKKVYTVEYKGFGSRRNGSKKRSKKRVKGDNGEDIIDSNEGEEEEEEILLDDEDIASNIADATASPATRKRNAVARRGRPSSPGNRGSSVTSRARNGSVDSSNDDALSQAPSRADSQPVTSYYLHEPPSEITDVTTASQAGPSTSTHRQADKPEFKTAEQAGLVQTYPKAGNFQPYFAYSTTTVGNGAAANGSRAGYNGNVPLRARRDTTASTSTEGGPPPGHSLNKSYTGRFLDDSGKGPSSTASFDQRGSDYDYAEEEKMTNALLAAKERGSIGKGIQEGKIILPDLLNTRNYGHNAFIKWNQLQNNNNEKERELLSASGSDYSSELQPYRTGRIPQLQQRQQQALSTAPGTSRLGTMKRAPAPPPRESSLVPSETTTATNLPPGNYGTSINDGSSSIYDHQDGEGEESFAQKQAKKSLGRRLGEIVRGFFIMLYWAIAGPVSWLKKMDAQTFWKSAGAILLIGLMLGSMYEQGPVQQSSHSSIWGKLPFISSPHHSSSPSKVPDTLPNTFDEVIQRLVSLEGSFRSIFDSSNQQYTTLTEQSTLMRDSTKRLAGLEAEFENERRKSTKTLDSLHKSRNQENDKVENTLKGIKNKLDSLNDVIKSNENERKTDSSDLRKLKGDLVRIHKDLDSYKGRIDMLVGKTDAMIDKEYAIKLVREAIEDILPSRLAVNIDSKTGQVEVDPKFWRYLQSHFSGGNGSVDSATSTSWGDFIASNSDKLKQMIDGEIDGRITRPGASEGAILSKKSFAEALERELRSLIQKVTHSTSERIARLSHEVEGKISKLHKASEKAPSIKLSSGQDINTLVSTLIDEALSKYSKDILGKPDFALYTAGGRVIPSLTSPSYEIRPSSLSGSFIARLTGSGVIRGKAPVTALHPDISTGQCWAINGKQGQLGILLSRRIYPSDITVEHASKDVALDVSSAPRNFEAWGIVSDPADLERFTTTTETHEATFIEGENKIGNMIRLVRDAYDVESSNNIQTFEVEEPVKNSKIPVSAIVFKILDNHGNQHLSCLYRVRVGGEVAEEEAIAGQ